MPFHSKKVMALRERIAKYLATRPTAPDGETAASELGLSLSQWWMAVGECQWFTFAARGLPSGWRLTKKGVIALGGNGGLNPPLADGGVA